MTATHSAAQPTTLPRARGRFTAWPLLIALTGVVGTVALLAEERPDNSADFDYPVTSEDILALDWATYRISLIAGYLLVMLMVASAVVWRHKVERRFPDSLGASAVGYGVLASAALATLAYGWRGALGNYWPGGPEENTYDTEGLYNYYVMNDFTPYIAFVPLVASAYGLCWMAFKEGLVSKPLGALAGVIATALLVVTFVMGVPGLPATIIFALVVAGVWLAVGRSAITR